MTDQEFATKLRETLESRPNLWIRANRLLEFLDSPDSDSKHRILERMRRHAELFVAEEDIDWPNMIETILPLLLAPLKIFAV